VGGSTAKLFDYKMFGKRADEGRRCERASRHDLRFASISFSIVLARRPDTGIASQSYFSEMTAESPRGICSMQGNALPSGLPFVFYFPVRKWMLGRGRSFYSPTGNVYLCCLCVARSFYSTTEQRILWSLCVAGDRFFPLRPLNDLPRGGELSASFCL